MSKFDELDREILAAIASGRAKFSALQGGTVWRLACAAGPGDPRNGAVDAGRVIDRRLQALRKRGVIAYGGGRWIVAHNAVLTGAARSE